MKKTQLLIVLLLALSLIPESFAAIDSYDIDFRVSLGNAYVVQEITYPEKQNFTFQIPNDASEISAVADGKAMEIPEKPRNITIEGRHIETSYLTKKFIDENNFVAEFTYPDDIRNLQVNVILSSNLELARPVDEGTLVSNAVFPKADSITSDGQRIRITWIRENAEKGDSISTLVKLREKRDYFFLIYILIIAAVAIAVLGTILWRRKPKTRVVVKTRKATVEEHLKEDEAQVIRILKSRGKQCEQGTLRVVTGFSKAKLSGLLKELEDRNIIYKEKRGKKNIIFLRE